MTNIAVINTVYDKSTGKIASGLHNYLRREGHNSFLCYGRGKKTGQEYTYKIDTDIEVYLHALLCRVTGLQGTYSKFATKRLSHYLRKNRVNLVYAVSLHGYYLNERMFFDYIAHDNISLVYIMIDEYAFLGKCGYSDGCINYLTGCGHCPRIKSYPKSLYFDRTRGIFNMKQNAYRNIKNKVFVGPEYTVLASRKSPLMDGIRTEIVDEAVNVHFYTPRDCKVLLRELDISEEKIIIVCVTPLSSTHKGVRYFIELARKFKNDERYIFVHVGYDSNDKNGLPDNYIAIGYEADQERLAVFYSMADLFVFPSLLDTMPNTCLEALACGSPLLCFNTSGMPFIADETTATFVEAKNVEQMADVVRKTGKKDAKVISTCRDYAVKRYDNQLYYKKLLSLGLELQGGKR